MKTEESGLNLQTENHSENLWYFQIAIQMAHHGEFEDLLELSIACEYTI